MRPLVVMIAFNRMGETLLTLESIAATTDLENLALVVVDNGSTDGTREAIEEWWSHQWIPSGAIYCFDENIGCPRALNKALALRDDGQPFVKIDNDVRILTPGWIDKVQDLIEWRAGFGDLPVGIIGAHYPKAEHGRERSREDHEGEDTQIIHCLPVIGHAVWHSGEFMDRVGFFDVLGPGHLYGFEDLLMCQKAVQDRGNDLGDTWEVFYWDGWEIENLQRHNSLGDQRAEHVEKYRPEYERRVQAIRMGGTLRCDEEGQPVE